MRCSNCGTEGAGAPRTLVVEAERELDVTLCDICYREFVDEPWIDSPA